MIKLNNDETVPVNNRKMTKLKTLKDNCIGCECCKMAKQEAIKWVKEMVAGVKRDWVIHFFNITEEDLNN